MDYTKGKWEVKKLPITGGLAVYADGGLIAGGLDEANAQLIASAPKLDRYREYVDAKIDIDEIPLRFDEFEALAKAD